MPDQTALSTDSIPETDVTPSKPKNASARYIRALKDLPQLSDAEKKQLEPVAEQYVFRANDYYLKLIDWDDPDDPIKQLIIPRVEEAEQFGKLDASNEQAVTVARGVQHKYQRTVLLLCNEVCGAYCRYCFRKRLFMDENDEVTNDVSEGLRYIAEHPEVSNVLLTGGDPLLMSARRLDEIFSALAEIEHVKIIRLGSKMPAFDPIRITNDRIQDLFKKYSSNKQRIYLMAHFDHPRELTPEAIKCLETTISNGVVAVNQCPILRGINDDADVLATLFRELAQVGAPPYYLFQGRPTAGNAPYFLPIVEGWTIFQNAVSQVGGLARRARYVMSHESGKLEVVAVTGQHIILRYHQAKDPDNQNRILTCKRDDQAGWFDDLEVLDRA